MMTIQCLHQVSAWDAVTQGLTSCAFVITFESLFSVRDINTVVYNNDLRSSMLVEKNKHDLTLSNSHKGKDT